MGILGGMPYAMPSLSNLVPTAVSYPAGAVTDSALVQAVVDLGDGRQTVLVNATPFHPVDHRWPDQGPD